MVSRPHPEMFINLLAEAVEAERLTRKARRSLQCKATADRFRNLFKADLSYAMQSIGPMDCVQQMASSERHTRAG